jgi:hypothetical protein
MLGKVLKYDLKNTYKLLIIFYIINIVAALACGLVTKYVTASSLMVEIVKGTLRGIAFSAIANTVINNFTRLLVLFKRSFYGDESYLTHTLPVKKETLYISKFITALITCFTSIVVVIASVFIMFMNTDLLGILKTSMLQTGIPEEKINFLLIALLVLVFLQISAMICSGYTGIIKGHRDNNHKILLSVVWGVLTYMAYQSIITVVVLSINPNGIVSSVGAFMLFVGIYAVILTALAIIDILLFKKGVNVD